MFDEPVNVLKLEGGEHHTVCVTDRGNVYCWGRNDEAQCGSGNLYEEWRRAEEERKAKEAEAKANAEAVHQAMAAEETKANVDGQPKKLRKNLKKDKVESEKEPELDEIAYFTRPHKVEGLADKHVTEIAAGSNYCYALVGDTNQLFSWGMGYNYVLGSREEDNLSEPTLVHPMQFHNNRVKQIGTGSQHVVVLTTNSTDADSLLPAFVADLRPTVEVKEKNKLEQ